MFNDYAVSYEKLKSVTNTEHFLLRFFPSATAKQEKQEKSQHPNFEYCKLLHDGDSEKD